MEEEEFLNEHSSPSLMTRVLLVKLERRGILKCCSLMWAVKISRANWRIILPYHYEVFLQTKNLTRMLAGRGDDNATV